MRIDERQRQSMLLGIRIAGDFGAAIAVPIVIFVLIGQWLDRKYGIGPWATVGAFVISALISGKIIYRKARAYGREFASIGTDTKPQ